MIHIWCNKGRCIFVDTHFPSQLITKINDSDFYCVTVGFYFIQRNEATDFIKVVLESEINEKKELRGPRYHWMDQVKENIMQQGME
jgi:hypothetical protein